MASFSCHVVGGAKQVRLERIVRGQAARLGLDKVAEVAGSGRATSLKYLGPSLRRDGHASPAQVGHGLARARKFALRILDYSHCP
jgi:hypothetical protein